MAGENRIVFVENDVTISVQKDHDNPSKCHTFFNPRMKICREFVLSCLKTFCGTTQSHTEKVQCLDAFGATGAAGIQWVKHCGNLTEVTINELNKECLDTICQNCVSNGITPRQTCVYRSVHHENSHCSLCNEDISSPCLNHMDTPESAISAEVSHGDANILLQSRQFHFIHIDPFGSTVHFMESTFRNVYNRGVVILTSTDVASLYGKCPQVLRRNYGAYNIRCDYTKEVAARIVLACATQAAARCNKGIEVLYCMAVEHFVQVAVRVQRGAQNADRSCNKIHHILHCEVCGDWAPRNKDKEVTGQWYNCLSCECQHKKPRDTLLELGPLWLGNIYNEQFLKEMLKHAEGLKLSKRCIELMQLMLAETFCTVSSDSGKQSEAGCENEEQNGQSKSLNCDAQMAPFFCNLHKRRFGNISIPRFERLIEVLRENGFCASRTHFDHLAVRTNATLIQLKDTMYKHFST